MFEEPEEPDLETFAITVLLECALIVAWVVACAVLLQG